MKKTLALTALAAATTSVCAQSSNLTVYGILDVGVTQVSGLRGGTQKAVVSGIMDGSRLGFRGNEDLGGGYRALFTIEHRLELDTGDIKNRPFSGSQLPDRLSQTSLLNLPGTLQGAVDNVGTNIAANALGVNVAGNMWDRQAFVGLVTPFGAVLAGRQYTPAYEASAAFDTLGTQSALSAGQAAAFPPAIDIRLSNAVAYRIQTGPFTASAMVTAAERSLSVGKMVGAMGIYKADRFSVGLGHNARENELGQKSLQSTVVGASLALGPGTAFAQVTQVKDDNPSGFSPITAGLIANPGLGLAGGTLVSNAFLNALRQDAQVNHVGYRLTTGPHTVYGAYTQFNDKRPSNADVASYGAAYTYALSKRTSLNAVAAHFDNKGLAQAAPGQAGFIGGVTATAGTDSNSFAVGIRHSF